MPPTAVDAMRSQVMRLQRFLKRALCSAAALMLDSFVCWSGTRLKGRGEILIVRLDGIGDFLLWSDAAIRLAEHYKGEGRRVVLLANMAWAELAESMVVFDEVWRLDRHRFLYDPAYRLELMRRVRRAGFEIAVQPTFSRELVYGDAVVRVGGRSRRIGSAGDLANQWAWQRRIGDHWYTDLVPATTRPLMELERNAEFLRGLGIAAEARIGRLSPPLSPTPLPMGGDYFVLFPGGSKDGKHWPPAAFAELAERIVAATGWCCVLAGDAGDREMTAAVRAATSLPLEDMTGALALPGLAALLRDARLLVSNDTSAVHMAAAVGTPAVCILGGGHFGRFLPYPEGIGGEPALAPGTKYPGEAGGAVPRAVYHPMDCYGCNWQCRYSRGPGEPFACIRAITVDAVWEAVVPLLSAT